MVFIGIADMLTFFCLYNFKFLQILSPFLRLKQHRHIFIIFSLLCCQTEHLKLIEISQLPLASLSWSDPWHKAPWLPRALLTSEGFHCTNCGERFMLAEVKLEGAQSWALPFCLHKVCLSAGILSVSASDNAEGSILQSLS